MHLFLREMFRCQLFYAKFTYIIKLEALGAFVVFLVIAHKQVLQYLSDGQSDLDSIQLQRELECGAAIFAFP